LDQRDLQILKDEFSEGGTIIFVHSPDDLIFWLEANYQHPLPQSMRIRGIGGPIAAMLSPEEPSLVVFGSIRDGWVVHAAELLSDLLEDPEAVQASELGNRGSLGLSASG
jgi:hypothetical protein